MPPPCFFTVASNEQPFQKQVTWCLNITVHRHPPRVHHRFCPQALHGHQVTKSFGISHSLSLHPLSLSHFLVAKVYFPKLYRKSMEMRHSKSHESEDWLRMHQMRSEAMRRSVALHARLLDPHSSLKEVHNEKLLQHRSAPGQLGPLAPEISLPFHVTS